MALRITPRLGSAHEVVQRIDETFHADPDRVSLRKIRRALRDSDPELPATRAMAILFASDFPDKHRDFEAVLVDDTAPGFLRHLAAAYLGRCQTPEAVDVLVDRLAIRDAFVLSGILKGLGASGDRRALEAIAALRRDAPSTAGREASIATAFIAHRLGIDGYELPGTRDIEFLDVDRACAGRLEITPADPSDIEFCLRCLGRRPLGVELSEKPALQIRCQRQTWIMLFNHAFATSGGLVGTRHHSALPGIVASRNQDTGLYALAFVLLTAPVAADADVRLLVCRTNGEIVLGGSARIEGVRSHFSLRANARPGAFAVSVEGTLEDSRFRIHSALASLAALRQRLRPVAEPLPTADAAGHPERA